MRALLACIAVVGLITLVLVLDSKRPIAFPEDASVSVLRQTLEESIETHGGKETYEAFKRFLQGKDFDGSHSSMHLFGETLFSALGTDGIAICDSDFNYGCYHGLVSAAVRAEGLASAAPLDAACASLGSPGSSVCQHGIGHGILEYVGHDRLREALDACSLTNQPDPQAGCTGGVFMEYNVPLLADADGRYVVAPRPLTNPDHPYAPCDTLSGTRFEQSCYLELPQWWRQVYPEDYTLMGGFCASLALPANERACIQGIGKIIPSVSGYEVDRARELCAEVGEGEAYASCIVQASWAFDSNTNDRGKAVLLCASLPKKDRYRCPS